ncbi:hypothetical protein H5410_064046 [Solanum commersonii]|uniref:Uncharacterized protein n=1 Tax=Solanum commersonii TaxID=4109 RepID=A0A9J5W0B4_SOLCO|nr:hypothetical protein H5410_064046 [Solanum commersonii]
MGLALPGHTALGILLFPWRVEIRGSDGHTTTPHPPRMQKLAGVEARVEARDGGYDGRKVEGY